MRWEIMWWTTNRITTVGYRNRPAAIREYLSGLERMSRVDRRITYDNDICCGICVLTFESYFYTAINANSDMSLAHTGCRDVGIRSYEHHGTKPRPRTNICEPSPLLRHPRHRDRQNLFLFKKNLSTICNFYNCVSSNTQNKRNSRKLH